MTISSIWSPRPWTLESAWVPPESRVAMENGRQMENARTGSINKSASIVSIIASNEKRNRKLEMLSVDHCNNCELKDKWR